MSNQSPNISRRFGISWSENPITHPTYTEPTSTLVLSSPTGQFVDIRLYLNSPSSPSAPPPSFESGTAFSGLEWAIVGQAEYTVRNGVKHGKWTHWISSRSNEEGGADEGDMVTREDGKVVETGRMVNFEVGEEMCYSEVWGDVPVKMLDRVKGAEKLEREGRRSYVVVKCHEGRVRGLIVWVGQFCQGVLKNGNKITAERWEYDEEREEWIRTFRFGEGSLPCGWLVKEMDSIKKGEVLNSPKLDGQAERWLIVDEDFSAD